MHVSVMKSFYALGFAALVIGNAVDVKEFCKDRPVGLYCSPDSIFQKIECPSGDFFTCQKAPNEFCQERGILKQHGFRGGIARCVPRLDPAAVASFCKPREKGVYCWGDFEGNIRVHCPSGLIYKCADNPTPDTKKCNQTTPTFAQCTTGGGGGGAGNCTAITVTIPETITQTKVVTSTSTQRETVVLTTTSVQRKTVTVNPTCPAPQTSTLIIPTTVTNVVPSTLTNVSSETTVDRATSTIIIVDSSTRVNVQTSLDVVSTKITETVSFETSVTVIPQTELINSMTVEVLETMTEFWTVTPTQTEGGGAAGTGTPTVITITVDPTTTYVIPTSTSDGPGPAGSSVTEITIVPSPTDAPCPSEGFQTSIPAPPGANFNYVLSAQPIIEGDARPLCRSLGGQLALIESTDEHWYLGQHICQPVWYSQWQGNVYQGNGGCIALYPGGASAVPTNGCFEQLIALCKVPA